jgi:hypothetical protein
MVERKRAAGDSTPEDVSTTEVDSMALLERSGTARHNPLN